MLPCRHYKHACPSYSAVQQVVWVPRSDAAFLLLLIHKQMTQSSCHWLYPQQRRAGGAVRWHKILKWCNFWLHKPV